MRPPYYDPLPFLSKIRDYCQLSIGNGNDPNKAAAFANWFKQVVMIDGATEYYKWFQLFPALRSTCWACRSRTPIPSPKRDVFSGMIVRKYDLNGLDADVPDPRRRGADPLQYPGPPVH